MASKGIVIRLGASGRSIDAVDGTHFDLNTVPKEQVHNVANRLCDVIGIKGRPAKPPKYKGKAGRPAKARDKWQKTKSGSRPRVVEPVS